MVLDDACDFEGHSLDYREMVYCERGADPSQSEEGIALHLYALVPCEHNPLRAKEDGERFPAVIFCQGSAFAEQWLHGHLVHHVELARRGYVVVSVEYRPSSVAPHPAQFEDFKEAVRFVRSHAEELRVDADRIGLWGDSSGAHTALMAGYSAECDADEGARVRCVADWYGPADFTTMNCYPCSQDHTGAHRPEGTVLGGKGPLEDRDASRAATPLTYISTSRNLPPTLILHGGRDELVPFNQSCRLYDALRRAGQEVTFYKLPDANHGKSGFGDKALEITEQFFAKHLKRRLQTHEYA